MYLIRDNELFLLEELVKRNFTSKYKDSVLGIFWTVLKPILFTILFTIIFSTLFKGLVEYYPVYFLSGRCIFEFFSLSVSTSMISLRVNKNIITKTAAPKHIFILSNVISELLNFLISVCILFVVMLVFQVPFHLNFMVLSVIPVISMIVMVTGLGLILSIICVYYSDIQHLWSVFILMLMYSSGVFYPMDIIPEPFHQFLVLNPLYWAIDQFRCFIYQGTIPSISYMLNLFLVSTIILVMGIIIFKKFEKIVTMKI